MRFNDVTYNRRPFDNTTNPDFYYLTDAALKAYSRIAKAINQRAPYGLLIGEPGVGKTTFLQRLMATENDKVHWIYSDQTSLAWPELLLSLGWAMAIPERENHPGNLVSVSGIANQLKQVITQGAVPILIIDEAQCLTTKTLKALFRWRTILKAQLIDLPIILAGQTELLPILAKSQSSHFSVETSVQCRLTKLSEKECAAMIVHRLKAAGYFGPKIFNAQSLHTVFKLSGGIPRKVNAICDLAMFTTHTTTELSISSEHIEDIFKYISLEPQASPLNNDSTQSRSSKPKALCLSQSVPIGSEALSRIAVKRWRQKLGSWAGGIASPLKALWPWRPRPEPRKKTIPRPSNSRSFRWGSNFWPWTCALASLLIVTGIGYHWFLTPISITDKAMVVGSRLSEQIMPTFKDDPRLIVSGVETIKSARPGENNLRVIGKPVRETMMPKTTEATPIIRTRVNTISQIKTEEMTPIAKTVLDIPIIYQPRLISAFSRQAPLKPKITPPKPQVTTKQVTSGTRKPVASKQTPKARRPNPLSKTLFQGIQEGNIDLVRKALSEGAEANALFSQGNTPLIMAASQGHIEITRILLDHGAPLNQATPAGETALMKTAWSGDVAITKLLLSHGPQVNAQNQEGRTPLFYASIMGRYDIVTMLLDHGAQLNLTDQDGRTPLTAAAWNNHQTIVKLLLSHGADPNHKDRDGWTPTMFAAFEGHAEVVDLLIANGADPSLKNRAGHNSADLAAQQGYSELRGMLLNNLHP